MLFWLDQISETFCSSILLFTLLPSLDLVSIIEFLYLILPRSQWALSFFLAMWLGISCKFFHHLAHGEDTYHPTAGRHDNMNTDVVARPCGGSWWKAGQSMQQRRIRHEARLGYFSEYQVSAHSRMDIWLWTHTLGLTCVNRMLLIVFSPNWACTALYLGILLPTGYSAISIVAWINTVMATVNNDCSVGEDNRALADRLDMLSGQMTRTWIEWRGEQEW